MIDRRNTCAVLSGFLLAGSASIASAASQSPAVEAADLLTFCVAALGAGDGEVAFVPKGIQFDQNEYGRTTFQKTDNATLFFAQNFDTGKLVCTIQTVEESVAVEVAETLAEGSDILSAPPSTSNGSGGSSVFCVNGEAVRLLINTPVIDQEEGKAGSLDLSTDPFLDRLCT